MTTANSAVAVDANSVNAIWKTNFSDTAKHNNNTTSNYANNQFSAELTSWASMHNNNNNNNNNNEQDVESDASNGGESVKDTSSTSPPSPSHHARRPMNAFLIFCKKHRPIVRDKFPTIENRGVTRILGEWWSLLDMTEKEPYTLLAKQYKDAFFTEHPGFKWYKLPAPPLRTIPTRPGKCEASQTSPVALSSAGSTTAVDFTPGKLADETQLGMLSSLFPSAPSLAIEQAAKPLKKRLIDDTYSNNDTSTRIIEQEMDPEENGRKSVRKGKGNRYADIMANGKLIKSKRIANDKHERMAANGVKLDLNNTIKRLEERIAQPNGCKVANCKTDECGAEFEQFNDVERKRSISEMSEMSETICDYSKAMPSFNLDARITDLPYLHYDAFVQLKKDSKKRKTAKGTKVQVHKDTIKAIKKVEDRKTMNSAAIEKQTGSKKRKNKRNITHLESNSLAHAYANDLSGLATLAEIAAEKERINDASNLFEC